MDSKEASNRLQLQAIADGLKERINGGMIPQVEWGHDEESKVAKAANIKTKAGLSMYVYANS